MKFAVALITLSVACCSSFVYSEVPVPKVKKMATFEIEAITPESRSKGWLKTHEERIVAGRKKESIDLLLIGDSITHSIGNRFDSVLGDLSMHNIGYGGDRTQHVLWRLKNGAVNGITPEVAVVMIGTNNAHELSPVSTAMGVYCILKELRERLPETKILLLGIFTSDSRVHQVMGSEANKILSTYSGDNYRKSLNNPRGSEQKIFYLDLIGQFRNEDGSLKKENFHQDELHLSDAGYTAWAKGMESVVRELLAD